MKKKNDGDVIIESILLVIISLNKRGEKISEDFNAK